jgi:hypothetical protein
MPSMRTYVLGAAFVVVIVALFGATKVWQRVATPPQSFTEECLADGNMWHEMPPLRNGAEIPGEAKPGCMTADAMNHYADREEYQRAKNPGESEVTFEAGDPHAGESTTLRFSIRTPEGSAPILSRQHERFLHVIVTSKDASFFRHIHPEDMPGFSRDNITRGDFSAPFTFPQSGEYVVAVDYANQLRSESQYFRVTVGENKSENAPQFPDRQDAQGIPVTLSRSLITAGEPTALLFTFGTLTEPIADLQPYLGAAAHVAIVKSDLSEFIHTHGEVHTVGTSPTKVTGHIHTPPPSKFGPKVESHVVFPSAGLYTVNLEFKRDEIVSRVPFTVRVEE